MSPNDPVQQANPFNLADHADRVLEVAETHPEVQGPVYVGVRRHGQRIFSRWYMEPTWKDSLTLIGHDLAPQLSQDLAEDLVNVLELNLTHNYEPAPYPSHIPPNVYSGLKGLKVSVTGQDIYLNPSEMIAQNLTFNLALQQLLNQLNLTPEQLATQRVETFEAVQLLVDVDKTPTIQKLYRGGHIVDDSAVTQAGTQDLADGLGAWMTNNVQPDGRLAYKIWPSLSKESTANNMIRQFMGTVCLFRWARHTQGADKLAQAEKNLSYNLNQFFRTQDDFGYIEEKWQDNTIKVKLGACALAGIAILESDKQEEYQDTLQRLKRLTENQWEETGAFRTFYIPADRNDCQNFYPGEALLFWSLYYQAFPEEALLEKFYQSFHYYRTWHLENRNPAFIPWHTQAYYQIWQINKDPELKDFMFEMNDWLLSVQQWDTAPTPDTRGRFYNPDTKSGPPHASATGVYIESLIEAFALAKTVGDEDRRERYRQAITRALRSVMQLQFRDSDDMFYVTVPDRIKGGVRSTVYDNTIRVDNVQHNLMGILHVLNRFEADDYSVS